MKYQPGDRNLYLPFLLVVRVLEIRKTATPKLADARDLVHLDANYERPETKHRRYSRLDLVRLALVARAHSPAASPHSRHRKASRTCCRSDTRNEVTSEEKTGCRTPGGIAQFRGEDRGVDRRRGNILDNRRQDRV